jgi:hypothetical protein
VSGSGYGLTHMTIYTIFINGSCTIIPILLLYGFVYHVPKKKIIKIHSSLGGTHEGNKKSNGGQKYDLMKSSMKEEIYVLN